MYSWSVPVIPVLPGNPRHLGDVEDHDIPSRLELFDTASATIRPAGPEEGVARMYVCGITPYDATHLGHANTYLTFDLVQRVWRDLGLGVVYAQNVTDVDDPLLERANETGRDWQELAVEQTNLFTENMQALNIVPPDHYYGVVESLPTLMDLLERLREADLLYQVDDPDFPDWYFRNSHAPRFGDVSHLSFEDMLVRFGEMGGDPKRAGKDDPLDCLVWRLEREGEPAWESPLGRGRPGWHSECSALAVRYLGEDFDVQGGGTDLIFPHHEMSAAQGRVATGHPFAQVYAHSGMVALNGQKMSKSIGNLELVSRLRANGQDPNVIRLAIIAHHYRSNWEWTDQKLPEAQRRIAAWRSAAEKTSYSEAISLLSQVRAALRSDLDTPAAVSAIDQWSAKAIDSDQDSDQAGRDLMLDMIEALLGVHLR